MNILRLAVPVELQSAEARRWRESALAAIGPDHCTAEVDLTSTINIDASGVSALLALSQAFKKCGGRVRLINAGARVVQLLELMSMHREFQFGSAPLQPSPWAKRTILVVEDELIIRSVAELSLRPLGHPIIMAENGKEAIDLALRENPAVIILDYVMPVMDGAETLRRLKSDPATKNIPVVVMSANEKITSGNSDLFTGASIFVTKPFNPTAFRGEVQRLLQQQQEQQQQQPQALAA